MGTPLKNKFANLSDDDHEQKKETIWFTPQSGSWSKNQQNQKDYLKAILQTNFGDLSEAVLSVLLKHIPPISKAESSEVHVNKSLNRLCDNMDSIKLRHPITFRGFVDIVERALLSLKASNTQAMALGVKAWFTDDIFTTENQEGTINPSELSNVINNFLTQQYNLKASCDADVVKAAMDFDMQMSESDADNDD
jgi:hypothetical protein